MNSANSTHKYGWMAKSFPYPIMAEMFDSMVYQLLAADVKVALYEVAYPSGAPKAIIMVTWKKPWEGPDVGSARA